VFRAERIRLGLYNQFFRSALAALTSRRWFMTHGPCRQGGICVTFDDGPHPQYTPRVLDVLRDHGVRATFFLIGSRVQAYPNLARRIVADGHAIGHHSFHHTEPATTSARQLAAEMRQTLELFGSVGLPATVLFRPPKGKLSPAKLARCQAMGQSIVLWNVDPRDYCCTDAGELRERINELRLRPGDVVLLHDNLPHTAAALPHLIHRCRERGLKFVTPADWIAPRSAAAQPLAPAMDGKLG
jgi:peptidoglycan/xylan/chitin deacetylase (PgdA/CDA1 family)